MEIAKEISSFVTQEFSTQRYKDFVSYVFSNGEGFEFLIEKFEEPEKNFTYIKKEYCLLPEPLNHKLQFYVFEVDSVNAKIGLYKELKKRLETIDSSAVLACFYQKGNPTFRLSLITRSLNEDGGIDYSSSKRQSFVLGNYNKTALLKFNELAKNTKDPSKTLEALTQAFSIENVTKEFYNKIVESFEEFAKEIKFPIKQEDTYTRQFILRMFSRILFCKFLEKKEVIPSKIWDREYIKTTNYYHDVLEPLFFQTLNTEKDCRDYGLIDTKIQELLRDIPYLNGGLFAPQDGDFFDPQNPTAHINDLIVPNGLFDDLFETLEIFHFTIDESTPLDQEVGLDPEMLGMVFENLLSVLFTDNKVDKLSSLRKKTGSYYTPREIVSYMVKSSILEYLKTNTKLNEKELTELVFDYKSSFEEEEQKDIVQKLHAFKVLDPACGSGAFPMGMLQEICLILEALNHADNPYDQKLSILQNNIYGVDIQPMAIEIARLRCFLSLICEEDKEHIAPLPNLEFKFISANSLISIPKNDNVLIYDAYNTIKEIMDQYFTSSDKKDLQKKYKEAQQIIAKEYQFSSLVEYDPFNPQSVAGFFDGELMFKIKEFDCVIGNPPYIKEQGNKELFTLTKALRTYQGKMDMWYHFAGRALELLKQNGELSFIATNNWTTNAGAKKLRNILLEESQFISLIDFGAYKVFESADIQTMIMRFKKLDSPKQYSFDYRKIIATKPNDTHRIALLQKVKYEGNLYLDARIEKKELIDKNLTFTAFDSIFKSILNNANAFLTEDEVAQGIVYPQENINKKSLAKLGNNFQIGQGIQKLSNHEKDNLKLSHKESELLKPIYETSEVTKYFTFPQNKYWVIYTDSSFKNPNSMDDYPKLKQHLDRFKEVITSDNKPYGLHRARDERFFTGSPRIIALRKCAKEPIFSYVDFDCYVSATFYIIKTDRFDSKFLIGLLNSSLIRFWLKHKGKMQGNNYQIDKEPLINIPLIKITESNKPTADKIIALVKEILKAKEQNPQANTSVQEDKIDEFVYQLYNLTPEEIAIIEGKNG